MCSTNFFFLKANNFFENKQLFVSVWHLVHIKKTYMFKKTISFKHFLSIENLFQYILITKIILKKFKHKKKNIQFPLHVQPCLKESMKTYYVATVF